jgi:hypothetical protein
MRELIHEKYKANKSLRTQITKEHNNQDTTKTLIKYKIVNQKQMHSHPCQFTWQVEWAEPEVEPADDHLPPPHRKKAFNKKYLNTETTKTTKATRKNIKKLIMNSWFLVCYLIFQFLENPS